MTILRPEIRAFLAHGSRTGKLGYVTADGRPLVAPIWFVLDGDGVLFTTGRDTAKGRAPRMVLCVDLEEPSYAFVQVQTELRSPRTPTSWCGRRPRSVTATWAPIAPRSSAAATGHPTNCWCGCARRRSSPTWMSPVDAALGAGTSASPQ